MSEYKHDFIDDNPYLVSADAPDTTVGEGGGEGGGGGGTLLITCDWLDEVTPCPLDKTWKEISDAVINGQVPYIYTPATEEYELSLVPVIDVSTIVGEDNSVVYFVSYKTGLNGNGGDGYTYIFTSNDKNGILALSETYPV